MAATATTTTRQRHESAPPKPKRIAILFAERQGLQATITEMERNGSAEGDEEGFQAACARLYALDWRILRMLPASLADLKLQAVVLRAAIDPADDNYDAVFARQFTANVADLA